MHQVVHLLELGEPDDLEGSLDQAAAEESERLSGVPAVADVGALDGDHLDDRLEDGSAQVGAGGETDANDGSAWADVLFCVSARLPRNGEQWVGRPSVGALLRGEGGGVSPLQPAGKASQ